MPQDNSFDRLSKNWLLPFVLLSVLYWLWFGLVVGVTEIEIGFYIFIFIIFFVSSGTRKLFLSFSPMFIYLLGYSSLKLLHNSDTGSIHNKCLYDTELSLFGFNFGGEHIIPCEYFAEHHNTFLDAITGAFYVSWMPFPVIFGLILFFSGKRRLVFNFWLAFLFANILGFIGYIMFPAAPPWYYMQYGAEIMHNAPPSAAGFIRFDELIGFPLYENMYNKGTNTFGAMPSMHAAFPTVLVYYSIKYRNKALTLLFTISMLSIWFGAIYSNHHYILDVIVGICCAIIGILLTETMVNRTFAPKWYKRTLIYIETN